MGCQRGREEGKESPPGRRSQPRSFSSRSLAANTNHTPLPFIRFQVLKPTVNCMLMKEHSRGTERSPRHTNAILLLTALLSWGP